MGFWKDVENKYFLTFNDIFEKTKYDISKKEDYFFKFNLTYFSDKKDGFKLEELLKVNFNSFQKNVEELYDYSNKQNFNMFFKLCKDDLNIQIQKSILNEDDIISNKTSNFLKEYNIISDIDIPKEQINFCINNLEESKDLIWLRLLGKVFNKLDYEHYYKYLDSKIHDFLINYCIDLNSNKDDNSLNSIYLYQFKENLGNFYWRLFENYNVKTIPDTMIKDILKDYKDISSIFLIKLLKEFDLKKIDNQLIALNAIKNSNHFEEFKNIYTLIKDDYSKNLDSELVDNLNDLKSSLSKFKKSNSFRTKLNKNDNSNKDDLLLGIGTGMIVDQAINYTLDGMFD